MNESKQYQKIKNVGFLSTRLAGTDGVSLETAKWAKVFEKEGISCFYFAGALDRPIEFSYLVEEAHFRHPDIEEVYRGCFQGTTRYRTVTDKIHDIKNRLKDYIYEFIKKFQIDLIIPQNVLAIPLNLPLGIAITEVISETGTPCIAHHHDFYWERDRFIVNGISDYLRMAFPPALPSVKHVVISSVADDQLSLRTGISGTIIPNVMDFDNPPANTDDYACDVRQALGIAEDELFILQPTRVVRRKGIEHAIELVQRLGMKAKLVISHAAGDEGYDYERRLLEYSTLMNVDTIFVSDIINEVRGYTPDGRKIYTLNDIYPHADLVTYPSTFEGFGNAFLEAIYYRKPVVVNAYSIYTKDIKPKGFSVIEIDGYVTQDAVDKTREILSTPELRKNIVDHNYNLGLKFFSYTVLHERLRNFLAEHFWLS